MTIESNTALSLLRRLPLSDAFLFLYVVVVARQFFWGLDSNVLGWSLAALVSAAIVISLRGRTPEEHRKLDLAFYLIVVLPLALAFLSRMPFPDVAFDVLNYRLAYSERTLAGAQFIPGDFFPYVLTFNPAADTLSGLFRKALGYRMGTIVGLFALIWTGAILFRMLRPHVENAWFRAGAVLAVLFTEQILFLNGSYVVDVFTVPLILEATRRAMEKRSTPQTISDVAYVALLLGVSVAFKVTNLAFAIPIAGIYLTTIWRERSSAALGPLAIFAAGFLLPPSAQALYIYLRLGNPIFPAFNAVFRSPYFAPMNFKDGRFGAGSVAESIVYPITSLWQPDRLGELQIYSGRVALAFACAIVCVYFVRKETELFRLVLLTIFSSLLWSLSTGYVRYALPLEIYGGLLIVYVVAQLAESSSDYRLPARAASAAILVILGVQIGFAAYFFAGHDWGGRPTAFQFPRSAAAETRYLFRDRDLRKFLSADGQRLVDQVDAWVISDIKTAGVEALLRPHAPLINVYAREFFSQPDFNARTAARALLDRTIAPLSERRIYSLCYTENLAAAMAAIEGAGLHAGETTPLRVRFFSDGTVLQMTMIEVSVSASDDGS